MSHSPPESSSRNPPPHSGPLSPDRAATCSPPPSSCLPQTTSSVRRLAPSPTTSPAPLRCIPPPPLHPPIPAPSPTSRKFRESPAPPVAYPSLPDTPQTYPPTARHASPSPTRRASAISPAPPSPNPARKPAPPRIQQRSPQLPPSPPHSESLASSVSSYMKSRPPTFLLFLSASSSSTSIFARHHKRPSRIRARPTSRLEFIQSAAPSINLPLNSATSEPLR